MNENLYTVLCEYFYRKSYFQVYRYKERIVRCQRINTIIEKEEVGGEAEKMKK